MQPKNSRGLTEVSACRRSAGPDRYPYPAAPEREEPIVTEFDDDFLERIHAVVQPGDEILTLSNKRPNVIAAIDREGIWVETLRSQSKCQWPG